MAASAAGVTRVRFAGGVGGGGGDQVGDLGEVRDAGERAGADLRAVGQDHHAAGGLDQAVVGLRLDLVVGADPACRLDAVHAEEGQVETDPGERAVRDGADQLVRLGAHAAAGHHQVDGRAYGQVAGDVEGVGDDLQRPPGGDQPG